MVLSGAEPYRNRPRPLVRCRHGRRLSTVLGGGALQMILVSVIGILLIGGVLAWVAERWSERLARWISLLAIGIDFVLAAIVWVGKDSHATGRWLDEVDWAWMPGLGIHFLLAVDGLSFLLLDLTPWLASVAVLAPWTEFQEKSGSFL